MLTGREQQTTLEEQLRKWQYWCADAVEMKVQKQLLATGRIRLPDDASARSVAQRLSFRARAWDFMLRSTSPGFGVVLEEKVGATDTDSALPFAITSPGRILVLMVTFTY